MFKKETMPSAADLGAQLAVAKATYEEERAIVLNAAQERGAHLAELKAEIEAELDALDEVALEASL